MKNFSRFLIVLSGVAFGIFAGYFLVQGAKGVSSSAMAFVSNIDLFEKQEVSQGGPDSSTILKDREGEDIYFLKNEKTYSINGSAPVPYLAADSYLVGDLDSGEIILSRNENKTLPIASISKLMTAVVADEKIGLSSEIRVSDEAVSTYGRQGHLSSGEEYLISEMFYPLLLESSNDAAEAIAESYPRDAFMREMNNKSREIDMYNSHFDDPSGLSSKNISSVSDLFKLVQYIDRYRSYIFEITRLKGYELGKKVWFNNSKFRSDDDYYGGKNGYTDIAWKTQIAIFEIPFEDETRKIVFIILKTDDIEGDIYGLKNYVEKYVSYQ